MSAFFSPPPSPIVEADPALAARTFSQNPTLSAALARLKTRVPEGINTGAEVPGGSDASDPLQERVVLQEPLSYAPHTMFAYLYQVETCTGRGVTSETIHVAADDICDAAQKAIAQLVELHADGVRVTSVREMKRKRGAA